MQTDAPVATTEPDRPAPRPGPLPLPRLLGVVAVAELAALVTWGVARRVGVPMVADRGGGPVPVAVADVLVATLVVGLAAWCVHGLLRRWRRATAWPRIASTVVALSILGPAFQADGSSAVGLVALHVVVGAVLVVGPTRAVAR